MSVDSNTFGINIGQEYQGGLSYFPSYVDATTITPEMKQDFLDDIRLLKSFGIRRFRFAAPDYTWADRIVWQKTLLTYLAQEGNLHIEYGIPSKNNPRYYSPWLAVVNEHVQWFQSLIDTYSSIGVTGKWVLGNEQEASWSRQQDDVVSVERLSNVVTVTLSFNHALQSGDPIIMGSSTIISAGQYTIASIPSSNTFTINNTGSNGIQYSGKVTHAPRTVRNLIRRSATQIKALTGPSITVPLAYSCAQGWEASNIFYYVEPWGGDAGYPHEGKGDVDEVHLNIYGESSTNAETNWSSWKAQADKLYADYPTSCCITEWNTNEDDTTTKAINDNLEKRHKYLMRRLNYLNVRSIPHYFFAYRMPSKLAEKYPAYGNENTGTRPSLYRLVGESSPFVEIIPQ